MPRCNEDGRAGLWTHAQLHRMDENFCRAMAAALGQPPPPPSPYQQLKRMIDSYLSREYKRRRAVA